MVLAVRARDLWIGYTDEEDRTLWAVRGVSLGVEENTIYCIVGESGCGKSTLGNAIVGVLPPYAETRGVLEIYGRRVIDGETTSYAETRGRLVTLIPQNPGKALSPYLTIDDQFYYVLHSLYGWGRDKALSRARELLRIVGLDPEKVFDYYPHELSGGMQQRAAIALALATNARIVVADEPTSALDANLRLKLLKLLKDLRSRLGLTIIMITHDLLSASRLCDRIAVMYAGKIVEEAPTKKIISEPLHPYTKMLIEAVPVLGTRKKLISYLGEPPSPGEVIGGCPFHRRCPYVMDKCREREPPQTTIGDHVVSCWKYVEGET